jgi:phosphoglycolate phosphatase-like HAD superfamily hydrolase
VNRTLLLDLDRCLGDTRPLWDDWLTEASRMLSIEAATLPRDRGAAAAALDEAGAGNWRVLLERFAEDRAPVYLRPDARVSAALRRLTAAGTRIAVFTDAPSELARVALAQLGAARRVETLAAGAGALADLRARYGDSARVVDDRGELVGAAR